MSDLGAPTALLRSYAQKLDAISEWAQEPEALIGIPDAQLTDSQFGMREARREVRRILNGENTDG